MRVLSALALALAAEGAHAQWLGPVQRPIPNSSMGGAADFQERPSIGLYDGGYWVVWQEHRNSRLFADVYGARVSTSGTLLDPVNVMVSSYVYDDWSPAIACTESQCLAAWQTDEAAVAVRLTIDGRVLDRPAINLGPPYGYVERGVTVVREGPKYRVLWYDQNGVRQAVVSSSGVVEARTNAPVPMNSPWARFLRTSNAHLMAHQTNGRVLLQRVEDDAGVSGPLELASAGVRPTLAPYGSNVVVVWSDPNRLPFSLQQVRTDLVPVGTVRQFDVGPLAEAVVVPMGAGVGIWYVNDAETRWVLLRSDGGQVGPTVVAPGRAEDSAFDDARTAVTFIRSEVTSTAYMARWLGDDSLVPGSELLLARTGEVHYGFSAAAHRDGAAVALVSQGTENRTKLVIFGADGVAAGPGIELSLSTQAMIPPRLVWDGQQYWAAWRDYGVTARVRRFDRSGASVGPLLDVAGAGVTSSMGLAVDRGVAAVCWEAGAGLRVTFVSLSTVGTPIALNSLPIDAHCTIASTPIGFLVFFSDGSRIAYRLVQPDGGVGSTATIAASQQAVPADAFEASSSPFGTLLVWKGTGASALFATRIGVTGAVLDTVPMLLFDRAAQPDLLQDEGRNPAPTFDGTDWWVAWDSTFRDGGSEVWARRVGLDAGLGPIATWVTGRSNQEIPALAAMSQGRLLLAWTEHEPPPGADSMRLRARLVASAAVGSLCLSDPECVSGRCVANTCASDAGTADAGSTDGGSTDGGSTDGGSTDGGSTDGGSTDGGLFDGGDPGVADGGSASELAVGCGCGAGSGGLVFTLLALSSLLRGSGCARLRRCRPGLSDL